MSENQQSSTPNSLNLPKNGIDSNGLQILTTKKSKKKTKEIIECVECKRFKPKGNKNMCRACYVSKRNQLWKQNNLNGVACSECGEVKLHYGKGMCNKCYHKNRRSQKRHKNQPKQCVQCEKQSKKRGKQDILCLNCTKNNSQQKLANKSSLKSCSQCKQMRRVSQNTGICNLCYQRNLYMKKLNDPQKHRICINCKKLKPIMGKGCCSPCYQKASRIAKQKQEKLKSQRKKLMGIKKEKIGVKREKIGENEPPTDLPEILKVLETPKNCNMNSPKISTFFSPKNISNLTKISSFSSPKTPLFSSQNLTDLTITPNSTPLTKKQKRLLLKNQVQIDNFKGLPSNGILTNLTGYVVANNLSELFIVSYGSLFSSLIKIKAIDCEFDKNLPLKIDGTFIEINNVMMKSDECVFSKNSSVKVLKKDENDLMAKQMFLKAFKSKYLLAESETKEGNLYHLEFIEQGFVNENLEFSIKTQNIKTGQIIYLIVYGALAFVSRELFKFGRSIVLKNAKSHENFSMNGQKVSALIFDENETKLKINDLTRDLSNKTITDFSMFGNVEKGVIFKCNIGFMVLDCLENELHLIDGKNACFGIVCDNKNGNNVQFEECDQGKIEEAFLMQGSVNGILKLCLHKVTKLDENADDLFEFNGTMPPMTSIYWNRQE